MKVKSSSSHYSTSSPSEILFVRLPVPLYMFLAQRYAQATPLMLLIAKPKTVSTPTCTWRHIPTNPFSQYQQQQLIQALDDDKIVEFEAHLHETPGGPRTKHAKPPMVIFSPSPWLFNVTRSMERSNTSRRILVDFVLHL